MIAKHAVHTALCVATIAFAFALAAPDFVSIPILWYAPADHHWTFEVHASGIAIGFYGRCLFATAVSLAAAWPTYTLLRRRRRALAPKTLALFGVWAVSLTALAACFFISRA